jgi:hypothetical protein
LEADDSAIPPDHRVVTEPALALEGFGDGVAQCVHDLLVREGEVGHRCASFTR